MLLKIHILNILILLEVKMWLAFAAKSAESNDIAFFLLHIFAKRQTAKKKYFAQYVSNICMEGVCKISMIAFNIDLTHFHFPKRQ